MELLLALLGLGAAMSGWMNMGTRQEKEEISTYRERMSDLDAYDSTVDSLKYSVIPELEGKITAYNQDIAAYEQYMDDNGVIDFSQTTDSLALKQDVQTYDDYLNNWQLSYDKQVTAQETQGKSDLSQLMANWSDAEVLAADRGASGSMSLVAQQQKQKAVDYAGSDLSLAGSDGLYGLTMNELKTTLAANKSQAESGLTVAQKKYDDQLKSQSAEYDSLKTTRDSSLIPALQENKNNLATAEANKQETEQWLADHKQTYDYLVKKHS